MSAKVRFIGLDVHKESIAIATADSGQAPATMFGIVPHDIPRLFKTLKKLTPAGGTIHVCYEAGPTGYELYRRLTEKGISCVVIAPSLPVLVKTKEQWPAAPFHLRRPLADPCPRT